MSVKNDFMWSALVHLSTNMWYEETDTKWIGPNLWQIPASSKMRFDMDIWKRYVQKLKDSGTNTIVIDMGDGVVYESHPELAIEGSLTKQAFADEISRLSDMGFTVIPKLNFSTTHDAWMKEYSRMVSTTPYYKLCDDLIDEVSELFQSKYFHIGMDEEVYDNQKTYNYVAIRQHELWWGDLYRLINRVERNGKRVMMWSDYARHRPDEFVQKCPKSVVQCVWYYFREFEEPLAPSNEIRVRPFEIFEKHGFDQVPGGSTCYFKENFELLTQYCKKTISDEHLLGFLQTSWASVTPADEEKLNVSAETIENARKLYYKS